MKYFTVILLTTMIALGSFMLGCEAAPVYHGASKAAAVATTGPFGAVMAFFVAATIVDDAINKNDSETTTESLRRRGKHCTFFESVFGDCNPISGISYTTGRPYIREEN
ncbi:hypothetical protein KJ909_04355 [Patescibacteria group bacterium]|nr:hypothetical protein [Patescibacteria group bacterium]